MKRKVVLAGEELEAHLETERQVADREAKHQEALDRSRRMMQADADSDSDSDDSGDEDEGPQEMEVIEPGSGVRRRTGGFAGGAGAWDEFLDPSNVGGAGGQSFDVYVKGAFSKRAVVDGRETLQRYRMFPVIERKRRVDAYGEAIDVEGWLKRGVEEDEFKVPGTVAPVLGKRTREEEEAEEVSSVSFEWVRGRC